MKIMPTKKAGHTTSAMLKENPADMIQAVNVVPILAPIITEIACAKVSNEALTNDTVITVVAVELCTIAVTATPVRMHLKVLEVILAMKVRIRFPAIFCRPPLISDIP